MNSPLTQELIGNAQGARLIGKTLTIAVVISHILFLTCFSCTICLCLHLALPPAPSKIRAVELPLRLIQCMRGENVPCPDPYIKWILTTAVQLVFMFYIPFACLLIYKLWSYTNWFKIQPKKRIFSKSFSQKSITKPKSRSKASISRSLSLPAINKKTLFLGLDGTLIFRKSDPVPDRNGLRVLTLTNFQGGRDQYVIQRPFVNKLLSEAISSGFEVVIFTAASQSFSHEVINWLDPVSKYISDQLYIGDCRETSQGIIVKDLSVTGRRLDRSVIVDVSLRGPRVCVGQIENAIEVAPFEGDSQDEELHKLLRFFELHRMYDDLRDAVSHYLCTSDKEKSQ
ncbi:CTD small [Carex littledalei]|uniref:Mitochondrial import inner membrane translocase subunit TIM50 n=1 Tax=Carex littledalei TaxID=544730 RepID=A0A833VB55_9POAL|nr:CTD small [Carex littledalei]